MVNNHKREERAVKTLDGFMDGFGSLLSEA
jgi:hypothetical protein